MSRRLIRVTAIGYYYLDEEHLRESHAAVTFDEALANERKWYNHNPENYVFEEITDSDLPFGLTFDLMPEDFEPY